MRAWELAASVRWAMETETLETLLEVAAGEGGCPLRKPEAVAARPGRPLENTRAVTIRDGVAVVPVTGPTFRRANLLTRVSGATSGERLARDLREAMSNPRVRAVLLEVDSPGGEANGVGEFAAMGPRCGRRSRCGRMSAGRGAAAPNGWRRRVSRWSWRRRPAMYPTRFV